MKNIIHFNKVILLGTAGLLTLAACSNPESDKALLKQANKAIKNQDFVAAAELYARVSSGNSVHRHEAKSGVKNLINAANLQNLSSEDLAKILSAYNSFDFEPSEHSTSDVYQLALKKVQSDDDKVAAHGLLHAAIDLNSDPAEDLSGIDLELITTINQTDPENLDAAIELAEIAYLGGDFDAAKNTLLPVKSALGDTEGARMLGQIFISEGNNKDAYPLLSAYTKSRLDTLQAAETAFVETQNELWDAEYSKLERGQAPDSFWEKYNALPETDQIIFVEEYVSEKVNNNPTFQSNLENYREAATIVPVVMDFGILQLRAAESMATADMREAELKAAEETFLSIKNIAGDTDDYKLYLGQVYFWLGKQDQGQALFDEVLSANQRAPQSLLSVAATLRSLGVVGQAEELTKEAYETAEDDEMRHSAAGFMQHFSNTFEDKIMWLERADTNSPYTLAALESNRGHLATQKSQNQKAAEHYRKSIEYSKSFPESGANYNNLALIYFSLHQVTGDQSAYDQGVDLMSKAVELIPDDAILLSNAANTKTTKSLYELLGDEVDFARLNATPALDELSLFYNSEAEKDELRKRLAAIPDFAEAMQGLERSILLSPNNLRNYWDLSSIYYFMNDGDAMSALAANMGKNNVDISSANAAYTEYVLGNNNDKELSNFRDSETALRNLLSNARMSAATKAVLHNMLSENYAYQTSYGVSNAADKAIAHARKSQQINPSTSASSNLKSALLIKASMAAAEKFPAYKSVRDDSLKLLGDYPLISLWLDKDDEISDFLRQNELVKEVAKIELDEFDGFPNTADLQTWAFIRHFEIETAEAILGNYQSSDLQQGMTKIREIGAPISSHAVLNDYYVSLISGNPELSPAKLSELEKLGINWPAELFE